MQLIKHCSNLLLSLLKTSSLLDYKISKLAIGIHTYCVAGFTDNNQGRERPPYLPKPHRPIHFIQVQ
jgi:hypothetical protein